MAIPVVVGLTRGALLLKKALDAAKKAKAAKKAAAKAASKALGPSPKSLRGKLSRTRIKKQPTDKQIKATKARNKEREETSTTKKSAKHLMRVYDSIDKKITKQMNTHGPKSRLYSRFTTNKTGESYKEEKLRINSKFVTDSAKKYSKNDLTKKINTSRKSDDETLLMKKALKDFDKIYPKYKKVKEAKRKRDKKEK